MRIANARWIEAAAAGVLWAGSMAHAATGGGPTGCVNLCDEWIDYVTNGTIAPCVVDADVTVLDGSVIDCEELPVHVTGGSLLGEADARFHLKAASVWVSGATHQISAACAASGEVRHGFTLETPGDIVVDGGGRLTASCDRGGGEIDLVAGGAVTSGIGANAITANGTDANGPGGTVTIRAGGAVTLREPIEARNAATTGAADGGAVAIQANGDVAIRGGIDVTGTATEGGRVHVDTEGAIIVELDGTLDASAGGSGDGGEIALRANGPITVRRPIKVRGIGATASGGDVSIDGSSVEASHEIIAAGGAGGGSITLESRGGKVRIGTWTATALLDVTRSSNANGDAGQIDVRSSGANIELGALADLDARGTSGGGGGLVELSGVGLVVDSVARVRTGGAGSGTGGAITLQGRGAITLSGLVDAGVDGHAAIIHRLTGPTLGGLTCPSSTCSLVYRPSLPASCGDEILREGVEQCDGPDLGSQDCTTIGGGFSGGTLACSASCVFDTNGCLP